MHSRIAFLFFFFNDTATTEIYTLSLHDALPIFGAQQPQDTLRDRHRRVAGVPAGGEGVRGIFGKNVDARHRGPGARRQPRSEEHTSELQSLAYLVCRLLLEKKKNSTASIHPSWI